MVPLEILKGCGGVQEFQLVYTGNIWNSSLLVGID